MVRDDRLMTDDTTISRERADLLETLTAHRRFLLQTAHGLTDEQARSRPTVSALSIGGIIKHVAETERNWAQFMTDGAGKERVEDVDFSDPEVIAAYQAGFQLSEDETLAEVIAAYEAVAAETDRLVRELPDLDRDFPLPAAPWFPPGATRSVRRVVTHIVAETAQHAGHADIIRETIDGSKTMG